MFLIRETAFIDELMNNIALIMHFVCGTHPNEGVPLITRCVHLEDSAVHCRIMLSWVNGVLSSDQTFVVFRKPPVPWDMCGVFREEFVF